MKTWEKKKIYREVGRVIDKGGGWNKTDREEKKEEFSYSAVNKTEELGFTKRKHPQALINKLVSLCVRRVNHHKAS